MAGSTLLSRGILSGLTVRRAIVVAVLVGVVIPAVLVGMYQARVLVHDLDEEVRSVLMRDAEVIALGVGESLWALDADSARALSDAMLQDPALVSVEIRDTQGNVFARAERAERRDLAPVHRMQRSVMHGDSRIGTVDLVVTESPFVEHLRSSLATLGGMLLIQIVGSISLIIVVLHQRIAYPLQRLSQEAVRLAGGDLAEPITPLRDDEIGAVERQLELTRQALRSLIESLEAKNLALEDELAERRRIESALRDSEQKFSQLFHGSPIALALLRRSDSIYLDVNESLASEMGLKREDMIGRNSAELGLFMDMQDRRSLFAALEANGRVDGHEIRLVTRAGQAIDCQVHMRTLQMDEPCVMSATVNISALRAAQRKVEELNTSLEQRVLERTRALAQTNRDLEEALQTLKKTHTELVRSEKLAALGSLVAGVSHELNTPIGNSLMVASTMRDLGQTFRKEIDAGLKRSTLDHFVRETEMASDILVRNLMTAGELITSFKQVAVDQTSSQRRNFSLHEVVHEIVVTLAPIFRKTTHSVEQSIPEEILMDSYPGPFGQVLTNLLSNTLLHAFDGRSHGKVWLEATRDGDSVRFACRDDGNGVDPAHLNKIFDPFFTTKLGQRGTGLGLNIVHNIVTGVLGGTISVSSQPGRGCTFYLVLPLVAPSADVASAGL